MKIQDQEVEDTLKIVKKLGDMTRHASKAFSLWLLFSIISD